jgi:hypothetical protein
VDTPREREDGQDGAIGRGLRPCVCRQGGVSMSAGDSCLERSAGGNRAHRTETPRKDDRNDESPVRDPEETELPADDDPEAD